MEFGSHENRRHKEEVLHTTPKRIKAVIAAQVITQDFKNTLHLQH